MLYTIYKESEYIMAISYYETDHDKYVRYYIGSDSYLVNRFSDVPSNATSVDISFKYVGYPTYFLSSNAVNDSELTKLRNSLKRPTVYSKTINDVTFDIYPLYRERGREIQWQRGSFYIQIRPVINNTHDPSIIIETDLLAREFFDKGAFRSLIFTNKIYDYTINSSASWFTKNSNGNYDGLFNTIMGNGDIVNGITTSNIGSYVNNASKYILDTLSANFKSFKKYQSDSNITTLAIRNTVYITNNISSILSNSTKTYTNSTWSTKKTWYIKVTFSKKSASVTNANGNVVNYVTCQPNHFSEIYYKYEATVKVVGFYFLKFDRRNRGSRLWLPLYSIYNISLFCQLLVTKSALSMLYSMSMTSVLGCLEK